MRLKREVGLGISAILVLQILFSMLAIGLLTRMGPAIERILKENVYSGKAVEEMLALLVDSRNGGAPKSFLKALERAKNNVTEKGERPLLRIIERRYQAAFRGNHAALKEVILALRQLSQVNRNSMIRADKRAQRMGYTGAWGFAMLGALALGLGILVYRRLRWRLELPILEVHKTTQRIRAGNFHARCLNDEWPLEVRQIADDLNWILDRWLHTAHGNGQDVETREAELHRAFSWLLEQGQTPAVLVDSKETRILMSGDAIALDIPRLAHSSDKNEPDWEVFEIPNTSLRLLRCLNPIKVRQNAIEAQKESTGAASTAKGSAAKETLLVVESTTVEEAPATAEASTNKESLTVQPSETSHPALKQRHKKKKKKRK